MGTYTWIQTGSSKVGSGYLSFDPMVLTIPSGATLKRMILANVHYQAIQQGTTWDALSPTTWDMNVLLNSSYYGTKLIYRATRAIPMAVTSSIDNLPTALVRWSAYFVAGENELGFNQRASYGTHDTPAFTISLSAGASPRPGSPTTANYDASCLFQALYYQP